MAIDNNNPNNRVFVLPYHAPIVDPDTGKLTPAWQAAFAQGIVPALKGLSGGTGGYTGGPGATGEAGPRGAQGNVGNTGIGMTGMTGATGGGGKTGNAETEYILSQNRAVDPGNDYILCNALETNGFVFTIDSTGILCVDDSETSLVYGCTGLTGSSGQGMLHWRMRRGL